MQAAVSKTVRLRARCRHAGMTLIEMVIAILLAGILAIFTVRFIATAMLGYDDLSRRAELVDAAEGALRRMGRDLRLALPNSVRVSDTAANISFALELIPILDGAKYNSKYGAATVKLTFAGDDEFDVFGTFQNSAVLTTSGIRVVINNLGTSGNDVYEDAAGGSGAAGVITSTATTVSISTTVDSNHHITLTPAYDFKGSATTGTNHRMYLVTTPVSYLCDASVGTLMRYYNYAITATQPTTAAAFTALNASSARIVNHVGGCRVYSAASDIRDRGLVTLALTLSDGGESVNLIYQVQLDNSL